MRKLAVNDLGVLTRYPEKNRVVQVVEISRDFNRFPNTPIREFPVYLVRAADNELIELKGGKINRFVYARYVYVSNSGILPVGVVDFESNDKTKIDWNDCIWVPDGVESRQSEK